MSLFVDREIAFLERHYETNRGKPANGQHSPTVNFGCERDYGSNKSMSIHGHRCHIIRKAIQLECSRVACHSVLIYRGSNFHKDSIVSDNGSVYSLSYGTGLFAGCLFDGGATVLYYTRNQDVYALAVPFEESGVFYVPRDHCIAQMCGQGETFHARTKAWKDFPLDKVHGMWGTIGRDRQHLKSEMNKDSMVEAFQAHKKAAVFLQSWDSCKN